MSERAPSPDNRLPVPAHGSGEDAAHPRGTNHRGAGAVDAQLLGQGGARRGLRGGAPVLDAAQHAYLEAEWSGPSDRRAPTGRTRREKV